MSPLREESLSGQVNEEASQNVGTGAAGGPHGIVGSATGNKKPRSRTKVQNDILCSLCWQIKL